MNDVVRADFRAQGAFANFIEEMQERLRREGRSREYEAQFWRSLEGEMRGAMLGRDGNG